MKKDRPFYEVSSKLEVARMVVAQGLTISQVCKDLSIGSSAVTRWVKQYRAETHGQTSIGHPITPEHQRIRVLEIESRQLREDNLLLKKRQFFCQTPEMKVNLVNTWQQKTPHVLISGSTVNHKTYSTQRYCKLIGINSSSYYAMKARQALPVVIKPEQLYWKIALWQVVRPMGVDV